MAPRLGVRAWHAWHEVLPRLTAVARGSGLVDLLRLSTNALRRRSLVLRAGSFALFFGALSVTSLSLAVIHDDSAAISRPPTTSAPADPLTDATPIGTQPFTDRRNPPSYRKLSDAESARYDLGVAVFNTQFVPAGTPNAGRRAGVGPLFNSSSCDACHNNGAHGRGPTEDGPASSPLVIQLATMPTKNPADPVGDPVYGRVLNTNALDGIPPEGVAMIHYQETPGHYPDGDAFSLRLPHYTLTNLRYGPMSPRTLVKPRLAPSLFGVGLLDAAAMSSTATTAPSANAVATPSGAEPRATTKGAATPCATTQAHGRFGWQATALSVQDQNCSRLRARNGPYLHGHAWR